MTTAPRVGDTVTVSTTAIDPTGQMTVHGIRVYNPGIPSLTSPSWSDSGNWRVFLDGTSLPATNLLRYGGTADPYFDSVAFDGSTLPSTNTKTATFVLDAPGIWKFKAGVKNKQYTNTIPPRLYGPGTEDVYSSAEIATDKVLDLDLTLPGTYPVTAAPGQRLVGAYVNAGQVHREIQACWQPRPHVWSPKWGPNPVTPLLYRTDPGDPTKINKTITQPNYLADGGGTGETSPEHVDNATRMGYELMYAGIDFVALDHTNLVFSTLSNNTDQNTVIEAAHALKQGLSTAAGQSANRVKMTFMLGLTTTWYHDEMDGANPGLEITEYEGSVSELHPWLNGPERMGAFNRLLQYLWDNFADPERHPHVWQLDSENGDKPLLLFYVGTHGPAFDRDQVNVRLTDPRYTNSAPYLDPVTGGSRTPMTVTVRGVTKALSQVFSIRWVGAFLEDTVPSTTTSINTVALRTGGSWSPIRVFNKGHWQFRPMSRYWASCMTGGPVNGLGQVTVRAVHATAYRSTGEAQFLFDLDRAAVFASPSFLMLTSFTEFGSQGDEPDPENSWTLMPNNKFGRRYSDLVRGRVQTYKVALP